MGTVPSVRPTPLKRRSDSPLEYISGSEVVSRSGNSVLPRHAGHGRRRPALRRGLSAGTVPSASCLSLLVLRFGARQDTSRGSPRIARAGSSAGASTATHAHSRKPLARRVTGVTIVSGLSGVTDATDITVFTDVTGAKGATGESLLIRESTVEQPRSTWEHHADWLAARSARAHCPLSPDTGALRGQCYPRHQQTGRHHGGLPPPCLPHLLPASAAKCSSSFCSSRFCCQAFFKSCTCPP